MSGQLSKKGIPSVTIELGWPMVVTEKFRRIGVHAIWDFLVDMEMITGTKTEQTPEKKEVYIFQEKIRVQTTGIIDYKVEPGENFTKGQTLGIVRNVFGKIIETVKAGQKGILFSHEDQSIVFPGQDVFTFVTPTTIRKVLNSI